MVYQPVDGGRRGHGILEYLLPFAERQVAGQHQAAPFVPFSQQREQHLHFLATLLYVPQVVDDECVELR